MVPRNKSMEMTWQFVNFEKRENIFLIRFLVGLRNFIKSSKYFKIKEMHGIPSHNYSYEGKDNNVYVFWRKACFCFPRYFFPDLKISLIKI